MDNAVYPVIVDEKLCRDVHEQIRRNFSDFTMYDDVLVSKTLEAILRSKNPVISVQNTRRLEEIALASCLRHSTPTKRKDLRDQVKEMSIFLKACHVLVLALQKNMSEFKLNSVQELLAEYPQFEGLDAVELSRLLLFRNMMKIALLIIPARGYKQVLLKIAGRLEGSQKDYVTGGGQTKGTCRRVAVYEKEGGVKAEKKRPAAVEAADEAVAVPAKRKRKPRRNSDTDEPNQKQQRRSSEATHLRTPQHSPTGSPVDQFSFATESQPMQEENPSSASCAPEFDDWQFDFSNFGAAVPCTAAEAWSGSASACDETTIASIESEGHKDSDSAMIFEADDKDDRDLLDILNLINDDSDWLDQAV